MDEFLKATLLIVFFILFSFAASKLFVRREKESFLYFLGVTGEPFVIIGILFSFLIKRIFPPGKALEIFAPFMIVIIAFVGFLYASNFVVKYIRGLEVKNLIYVFLFFALSYYGAFFMLDAGLKAFFGGCTIVVGDLKVLALSVTLFSPFFLYMEKKEGDGKKEHSLTLFISYFSSFFAIIFFGFLFYRERVIRIETFSIKLSFLLFGIILLLSVSLFSLLSSKLKREEVMTLSIGILAIAGGMAVFTTTSIITIAAVLSFLYVNMPYRIKEFKLIPHLLMFEKPVFILLLLLTPMFLFKVEGFQIFKIGILLVFIRFFLRAIFILFLRVLKRDISFGALLPYGPLPLAIAVSYFFIVGEGSSVVVGSLIISQLLGDFLSSLYFFYSRKRGAVEK